jgi:hypothetical protein
MQIKFLTDGWSKYSSTVRDFDRVLEHAKAVSASLVGITPQDSSLSYGEQLFVKLLAHSITLRELAPDPSRKKSSELWDLPSMAAVARCAIETHDAFVYISLGDVEVEERSFRLSLWKLHDKSRRLKMLDAIGSQDPRKENIRSDVKRLLREIQESPFYASLSEKLERRLADNDPPPYYLSQRERCRAYGVNYDYYNAATMQLSQYVHSFPYATHQLFHFKAGGLDELKMMSLPMEYTIPFLSRVTDEMRLLFPEHTPVPPRRTAKVMALWRGIYAGGLKQYGDQLPIESC